MRRIVTALALGVVGLGTCGIATSAGADTTTDDSYLEQAAAKLAEPGVYADPAVLRSGRLTSAEVASIAREAGRQRSTLRIWVLPATSLRNGSGSLPRPRVIIGRLHALVGEPGTYALLTAAPNRAAGQSFFAFQWAGSGPVYRTGKAAKDAIACCAPKYADILTRFAQESDVRAAQSGGRVKNGRHPVFGTAPDVESSSGGMGAGGFLVVGFVVLAVLGLVLSLARRGRSTVVAPPPVDPRELHAPLSEEIEQVRQQISQAEASSSASAVDVAPHVAAARQALDRAHGRLTTMASQTDVQAVASALADARFELAAATAVRDGRPVPERTAPCFVDPRHGPSVSTRIYPPSGITTPVPVCAACDAALAGGTTPAARPLLLGGSSRYAWMPYGPAWWYLMGYWGQQPFINDLTHHQSFLDSGGHAHHDAPSSGGGGFFGGGGGLFGGGGDGGHHGGFGGGGGHHGGFGGGGFGGGHGGGGGFGGGGHGGGGGGGHHG